MNEVKLLRKAIAGSRNLQEGKGKATPYQVRQLLKLIERCDLKLGSQE